MNPFTESTVARPLSESPSDTAKENKPNGAHQRAREVAAGHKPSRLLRPARMARRRGQSRPARRSALSWPRLCRRVAARATLGLCLGMALPAAWAVNVNSATVQQLETINGIGPKTAQVIIDERTRGGSFESFDDLAERVKGIGPKKIRSLQASGLTLGQGEVARTSSAAPPSARKSGR